MKKVIGAIFKALAAFALTAATGSEDRQTGRGSNSARIAGRKWRQEMADFISSEAAQISLCDDCRNKNCPMQSGIKRTSCAIYKAPTKSGYIQVEDAIKEMKKQYDLFSDDYHAPHRHGVADCIEIIKDIPTADVRAVVRGHYIGDYDGYADGAPVYDIWSCSACGCVFEDWDEKPTYNFCPNCGADMREEAVK